MGDVVWHVAALCGIGKHGGGRESVSGYDA